jgi:hypothetical protein
VLAGGTGLIGLAGATSHEGVVMGTAGVSTPVMAGIEPSTILFAVLGIPCLVTPWSAGAGRIESVGGRFAVRLVCVVHESLEAFELALHPCVAGEEDFSIFFLKQMGPGPFIGKRKVMKEERLKEER